MSNLSAYTRNLVVFASVAVLAKNAHAVEADLPIVCSQIHHFAPWREPARGWLGRYPNQPLLVDPDLPDDPDRTDIPEFPNWGAFTSQADYDINLREAKAMGLDGLAVFSDRKRRHFTAADASSIDGIGVLPMLFLRDSTPSNFVTVTVPKFMGVKRLVTLGGKIVVPSYWASKHKTPDELAAIFGAARENYGDKFIFFASLPTLARERVKFEKAGRKLTDAARRDLEEIVRSYARVADGIQLSEAHMICKIEDGEKAFGTEYWDELHAIARKVLSEPEFGGKKLLGSAAVLAHINTYKGGPTVAASCTRTLRESMEVAIKYNADLVNLPEFDEFNENTNFAPTLYGSFAVRRIVRHYIDRMKKRPFAPQPGDDVSKPNLIVSYRKSLSPGELLAVEVLNVPDGSRSGALDVAVELADENGETLKRFTPRQVDEGKLDAVRFDVSSADLAQKCRAVQVRLEWRKDGMTGRITEGFHPVDLCPGGEYNHICAMQPVRDLAEPAESKTSFNGKTFKASFRSGHGNIRYAMLCGNGCIQAVRGKSGHPADLFREDENHAVFQIIAHRFNWDVETGGKKDMACSFAIPGVEDAEWLYAKRYEKGERFEFPTHRGSGMATAYYVRVPKAKLEGAVLKADFPGAWSGEVDLEKAYRLGAYSVGESVDVMQFTVARFDLQARYPSVADAPEIAFELKPSADRRSMMYHAQFVMMDGKTWFSRPYVAEDPSDAAKMRVLDVADGALKEISLPSSRIPDLGWDFSPQAGQVAMPLSGERHWRGMTGGFPTAATLWNRGYLTEGFSGWGNGDLVRIRVQHFERNGTPRRVQEEDGSWSLEFDGYNDFLALPWSILPSFAAFEISFDAMPFERDDGKHAAILSAYGNLAEIGIDADGQLTLCYAEMLDDRKMKTGLYAKSGEWSKVRLVCTGEELMLSVNGKDARKPLKVTLPGQGISPVSVGGYDSSKWRFGFFKGRLRDLHISQKFGKDEK